MRLASSCTLILAGYAQAVVLARQSSNHTAPPPPAGGNLTNPPDYHVASPFDLQSINLGLNQEYIELDLFHNALARFSVRDFENAGLTAEDRFLIEYMADQELGHAITLSNLLGSNATKPCNYSYPFTNVKEFIDFSQAVTAFGESGTYGFIPHLDSKAVAQIVTQTIAVEARQQMAFRQFEGLFPMPFYNVPGISQSMQWTLLAPYLASCPSSNTRVEWVNFPTLNITNAPSGIHPWLGPAITHNRTALTNPGREVHFRFEAPGKHVGPKNFNYTTATNATTPKFAAWISQLNVTYTPLHNVSGSTAITHQPDRIVEYAGTNNPIINGTIFVMLTDANPVITPFNVSMLDAHIVAGPSVYTAG
ncbi:hypothetical protein M422DRAFT_74299 [Sphaerobolus stellatus SS14]|nr:hypothetical protein M422DRAFT_74299 [Sphaerobolus stellatus SS14]